MSPAHRLVDTHAHLEELPDLPAALERAGEAGVTAIVAVGSDPDSNRRVLEMAATHVGFVYAALGLHPGLLTNATPLREGIRFMEDHLPQAVAVGEVGLDYHKRVVAAAGKELQHRAFNAVLALARRSGKPAIIHSRYAWRDSFTLASGAGVDKAVFHWYTGPTSVLREIIDRGYFISATPAVEYHAEHRRAVKEAPLESLLLETDCPVAYQGHRSEPADVARVLLAVAEIKGLPPETVAGKTTDNAHRLFGLQASERG
ncbi:MAG: TatD family deoxyribonuclease [Chloroflexi bacterium]|nr:TatD family deoxyribonuclease [Chloroflexota bacterium]